ncbi:uncharacterized protein LOC129567992 isoform X1 [Sitodiplosis mosellana]|uniref:uncharacterized protein LOC129567992 isoform X1 n=1 Tax=Sitodiplosis mosellana TaxID=263140 RepID=UPI00244412A0|nr:uncharacterized protein LOC129567992 isoform X1 [Sitodiplosis mosellana]
MDPQNMEEEQTSKVNERQQNTVTDQPPPIFKLMDSKDCDGLNKLLDYLPIDDLHSLGQTCERMQRAVGRFYQQRLTEHVIYHDSKYVGLRKYAKVLTVSGQLTEVDWKRFESVKRVLFWLDLFSHIKKMPKRIPIKIEHAAFDKVFRLKKNEIFFDGLCAHLQRLEIWDANDDEWLSRKYPKLEHFAWYLAEKTHLLQTFFQLNPAIRSFSTVSSFCLLNKSSLKKVKLDDLFIFGSTQPAVCDLLNTLHSKDVYKQLYITSDAYQENIDRLNSLKSLVGFAMYDIIEGIDLSRLVNLKVLSFKTPPENIKNITNKAELARSLEHLEEVRFWVAHIGDILPFIQWSIKLKKVIVDNPLLDENGAIDSVAMNCEREKLLTNTLMVSKVTIYISESNYLATKWKTPETNLKMIEIQRRASWASSWFWHLELF